MSRLRMLFAAPLIVAASGCYRPDEPGVAVSGRVTYKGRPIREAGIFFTPDIDKRGRGGQGIVSNGRYSIPLEEGLLPGEFNVMFVDPRWDHPKYRGNSTDPLLPEHYRDMNGLRVTIPARKSYSFDFDLD